MKKYKLLGLKLLKLEKAFGVGSRKIQLARTKIKHSPDMQIR
jgi:hypothetical protein